MISPFAPLFPWLLSAIMFDTPMCVRPNGQRARLVSIQRTRVNGPTQYKFAEYRATWTNETPDLDLRHGPTRYAVLRALHDVGHSRPWALGAPWSPLTDEQAGRATAEILRAVGEDPTRPVGVVPVCVLEAWREPDHADRSAIRYVLAGDRPGANSGYVVPACEVGPQLCIARHTYRSGWRVWPRGRPYLEPDAPPEKASGPETDDAGRLAADTAARALGCLMIEELTPT